MLALGLRGEGQRESRKERRVVQVVRWDRKGEDWMKKARMA